MDYLKDFLGQNGRRIPGKILYAKVWGSHSHGTQLPTSDVDFLGVYAAPTSVMLGLDPAPETVDGKGPDFQFHEVRKFCGLLLKGNPGIVEMLFTERMEESSPEWNELREIRRAFLTQRTVKQYLGYAEGQLKKLAHGQSVHSKGGVPGEKWAYHMIRLLLDADRISKGDEPKVWKDGSELDLLMEIRRGAKSQTQIEQLAKDMTRNIDARKPWKLPEEVDRELLNAWLLKVRGL